MTIPESGDATGVGHDRGSPPGTPRWVKVSGVTALVLLLLVVIGVLTGRAGPGGHGPGRHGGDTPAGQTPLSGQQGSHAPPGGSPNRTPPSGQQP